MAGKYNNQKEDRELTSEELRRQRIKNVLSFIEPFVIAIVVAMVLKTQVIIMAKVPTGSMLDTIQVEDLLMGNRLVYKFSEPKRGDVVIFRWPDDESKLYIKRLIGLPGEKVVIDEGKIYINDSEEPLEEPYLKDEEWVVGNGYFEFQVPEDGYLMLGDNRNGSEDARYWKNTYVTKDELVARAEFIWFPFSNAGSLHYTAE